MQVVVVYFVLLLYLLLSSEESYVEYLNGDVAYLNGDVALPILSRQSRIRTSSLHTVQAILDTPKELLCTKHPTQININCAFVVDTSKLHDPGDTKCDDCGTLKQTKMATTYLKITFCNGGVDSVKCCSNNGKLNHYTLVH